MILNKLKISHQRKVGLPFPFYKNKTIFIHIPKCAGSSFCLNNFGYQIGHRKFKDLPRHTDANEYFVFSIVRDPYQRALSGYKFLKSGGLTRKDLEFSNFILKDCETPNDYFYKMRKGQIKTHIHFEPMHIFLEDSAGYIQADMVYKLEDIQDDIVNVQHKVTKQWLKAGMLDGKKVNASVEDDIQLDEGLIRQIYQRDYYLFGY